MCRRRTILILGGLVLLIMCIGAVIGMFVLEQEKKEVRDNYGNDVAKMCDTPGGGAADLANLSGGEDGYRFLILDDDGLYHDWHDKLPNEMRAADGDELDVVICFEESSDVLESCEYYVGDDESDTAFTVERVRYETTMILLNAETGARIAETTIIGGMPDKCPDETRGREGEKQQEKGSAVSYNDFYTALLTFVDTAE